MNKLYKTFLLLLVAIKFTIFHSLSATPAKCILDFADGLFQSQMKEHHIAGLTFAVFSGDSIEATRSYGYAHIDADRLVDKNTGFMVGSVSKLFVWVSVMQLVENNQLDINKPVNDYLTDFRLPDDYKPVTMKHLMTHTPGFEENLLNLFSKSHENLPDLETYLIENLPAQIYNPGTVPAYSNYGVSLAAYVVEQITGIPFNDYVDVNIFGRLGMEYSTFRQPAGFVNTGNKSRGYVSRQGRFVSPFEEFVIPYPAGSAVSTASDMLKFMKAILVSDNEIESPVLKRETIDRMFTTLFTPHPQIPGMAHGFMKMNFKGLDVFWHGGATYFFHSAFVLVPEKNTGFFFSINTGESKFDYLNQVALLLDYLFNSEPSNGRSIKLNNGLKEYTGRFIISRKNESNFTKLFNLFLGATILAVPDGLLLSIPGMEQEFYYPYANDVFRSGENKLVFLRDEKGEINGAMVSQFPVVIINKISWRESVTFNIMLLLVVFMISLKSIIYPLVHLFKKAKRKPQVFRWFMFPVGFLSLLFFILFFTRFSGAEQVLFPNLEGFDVILAIPLLSFTLFISAVVVWVIGQEVRKQSLPRTFWQFIAFTTMVVFYVQMYFWNLFTLPFI